MQDGEHAVRLHQDMVYFAENNLKLRSKAGPISPFVFNPAQLKLHQIIEEQKRKTGRVRVVVLKGAADGGFDLHCSTLLREDDSCSRHQDTDCRTRTASIAKPLPDCEAFSRPDAG
jgi:hypothetical protein